MQGFTYENQGQNTYLVYHFDERQIDTMALGMLTNNKIKGFAPAVYTEIDNEKYIKYNVSSHVTLSKLFIGDVKKLRLLKTFINISEAMLQLDDYMLDRRTIMLNTDYVYVDASTSEVSMICVPVVDEFEYVDEREFFKNIIFSVSFSSNENGDYVARILAYLNSTETFQLQEFKKLLESLLVEQGPVRVPGMQLMPGAPVPPQNPYQSQRGPVMMGNNGGGIPAGGVQVNGAVKPNMPQRQNPNSQMQNAPMNSKQEPAIQNVYLTSAKNVKMAKRDEMIRQKEEELAKEKAKNPIVSDNMDMGFAVPGMSTNQYSGSTSPKSSPKKTTAASNSKSKNDKGSSDEDISLFYLMQHYSKENMEKYKATKERKKAGNNGEQEPTPQQNASQSVIKPIAQNGPVQRNYTQQNPYQTNVQARRDIYSNAMQAQAQGSTYSNAMQAQAQGSAYSNNMQAPMQGNQYQAVQPQMREKAYQSVPNQMINNNMGAQAPVMMPPQSVKTSAAPNENQFDQTTLMKNVEEDMGTTVLTASTMVERHPYLYQVKNGTKLYLTKKTNRIGKNREVADICIEGNPAISRCHAIIYQIEDTCYVEDLNSTNGTYVDDRQITSNNKTALRVGSRLKLADEEFELRYD